MKSFWLLLLFCLPAWEASAQTTPLPALDSATLESLARHVVLPVFGLYLLCSFVITAVKLVLNFLLKRQIVASATSERIVERLLPGQQDEQKKVVKWIALLLSSGGGLLLCTLYPPVGIHSLIILLFSTAVGFSAYYLFLRRQAK